MTDKEFARTTGALKHWADKLMEKKMTIDIEQAAHLAEITIVVPKPGAKSAKEVAELLDRQRQMIAERIRGEGQP